MRAIIFDFWGTLVEHGVKPSPMKQVKAIIAPRMSYTSFVVLFEQTLMTRSYNDLYEGFTEVLKNFGKKPRREVLDKLVAIWNKNKLLAKPFPETMDILTKLKEKYMLGIIANTDSLSVPTVIEKYQLDKYMNKIIYSYKEGVLKSSGELLKKIMNELGVSKNETVMIGDSIQSDIEPAKKLGVKAILVDRRNTREYEPKIMSLEEIEKIMG
ncbi:HAD family hydrolase [Candidatus Woesearchaeota archaeon]|nr:HAD family hydrolase [Candidatus Woesearchaeota archaeon]